MRSEFSNRPATRMLAAITVALLFAPVFVQAQELETVRNETLGFVVGLPGGSWIRFSTEEDSTSVNGMKGASVSVGPIQMPAKTLEQVKAFITETSSRSEGEFSVEEFEHPVGPALHWSSVAKKGDQRQVEHSYFIEGAGEIYTIDCSSKAATDQEKLEWDELCQAVLDSFSLI
jgi:hypothetical protein